MFSILSVVFTLVAVKAQTALLPTFFVPIRVLPAQVHTSQLVGSWYIDPAFMMNYYWLDERYLLVQKFNDDALKPRTTLYLVNAFTGKNQPLEHETQVLQRKGMTHPQIRIAPSRSHYTVETYLSGVDILPYNPASKGRIRHYPAGFNVISINGRKLYSFNLGTLKSKALRRCSVSLPHRITKLSLKKMPSWVAKAHYALLFEGDHVLGNVFCRPLKSTETEVVIAKIILSKSGLTYQRSSIPRLGNGTLRNIEFSGNKCVVYWQFINRTKQHAELYLYNLAQQSKRVVATFVGWSNIYPKWHPSGNHISIECNSKIYLLQIN